MSSRFGTEFPSQLTGKLAPEELEETLRRVNFAISRTMNGHGRWLLCGLFFCCCTCGCSLLPTYYLSNRVRSFAFHTNISYNPSGCVCCQKNVRSWEPGIVQQTRTSLESLPKVHRRFRDSRRICPRARFSAKGAVEHARLILLYFSAGWNTSTFLSSWISLNINETFVESGIYSILLAIF